jgi:hypothetical protein
MCLREIWCTDEVKKQPTKQMTVMGILGVSTVNREG